MKQIDLQPFRFLLGACLALIVVLMIAACAPEPGAERLEVIVQGNDVAQVATLVNQVGGDTTHQLSIIDAVGAQLTAAQLAELKRIPGIIKIYENSQVQVAGAPQPDTIYPTLVGADKLHATGITGQNVTVAVLDTGSWDTQTIHKNANNDWRILAKYDAIANQTVNPGTSNDDSGHGTHVSSIILSSDTTKGGHQRAL